MPRVRKTTSDNPKPASRRPPATTPEGREAQLVSLAVDLVERRLIDGTATAAETVHILKLGSERERLERDKLARENALLTARVENIAAQQRIEEVYEQALAAKNSPFKRPEQVFISVIINSDKKAIDKAYKMVLAAA